MIGGSPLTLSALIALHGDRAGPALILAGTSSGHACGAVPGPAACSRTRESACSVPGFRQGVPRRPDMVMLGYQHRACRWPGHQGPSPRAWCAAAV